MELKLTMLVIEINLMLVKGDTLYSASANRVYKRKRKSTLMWDWLLISICLRYPVNIIEDQTS